MMRPSGLKALLPDVPGVGVADARHAWTRTASTGCSARTASCRSKPTPPPFRNHGNHMVSVAELSRWLATRAEEAGAYILTETSAHQLLVTDGVVRGIRSGDKGRGKDGEELSNFEPGSDVTAAPPCWPRAPGAISPAPRSGSSGWPRTASRRCGRSGSRRCGRSRSRSIG